jgi:glucose/arabinose dehydrogenase
MRSSRWFLAAVIAAVSYPALRATGDAPATQAAVDVEAIARRISPEAVRVSPADVAVVQWERKPAAVADLFRAGGGYVIRLQDGRWCLGQSDDADPKQVSAFRPFDSVDQLLDAVKYLPEPKAPDGFALRTLAAPPHQITRLAHDAAGTHLFALGQRGDLWRIELATGKPTQIAEGRNLSAGNETGALGVALDAEDRLFLVVNERDATAKPHLNRVTIYRSAGPATAEHVELKPWLRTQYPWGVGGFNHGVAGLAFGPDGMLYVGSGSRTDANETGNDPNLSTEREVELTSCLWRLDPRSENPEIEIYADGLRNPFGFCWDGRGRMIATESGPDAMPPEELNVVEQGKHYGFPWRFSDWPINPYPHVGEAPKELAGRFVDPIVNLGPDGGASKGRVMSTFTPHTSPVGICYLGEEFGEKYAGTFLVARFGTLVQYGPRYNGDVLHVRLSERDGKTMAETHTFLPDLCRAIDVHAVNGKIYVAEYARGKGEDYPRAALPGRILELTPTGK